MHHGDVEARGRQRRTVQVALAHRGAREAGLPELRARGCDHVATDVQADAALADRRQQLEHAPGSGADVEQALDRLGSPDQLEHRAFDVGFGDLQRAERRGLDVVAAQAALGGRHARLAHTLQRRRVGGDDGILGRSALRELSHQLGAHAAVAEAVEHVRALRASARGCLRRAAAADAGWSAVGSGRPPG